MLRRHPRLAYHGASPGVPLGLPASRQQTIAGADGSRWASRTSNPLAPALRSGWWVRLPRAPAMNRLLQIRVTRRGARRYTIQARTSCRRSRHPATSSSPLVDRVNLTLRVGSYEFSTIRSENVGLAGLGLLCDLQNYPATVPPRVPQLVSLRGRREEVVQPPRKQMPCMLGQAKDNRVSRADLIHEV